jgi:hypothetical protein
VTNELDRSRDWADLSTEMDDELPGMWERADFTGGLTDTLNLVPEFYKGVRIPETLRPNWFHNRVEVSWWKAGVDSSRVNGKRSDAERNARNRAERRKKSCTGKFAWDDPYDALREMFSLPYRVADMTDYDLSLYRCEFCDFWHLGKMVRMWNHVVPDSVPEQMSGQIMIKYPELKDHNPGGFRNTRRDGKLYE